MSMKSRIESKLRTAFSPEFLDVIDESHLHAGHAGARPGGETHYRVRIKADAFSAATRLQRHRMVNEALAEELAAGVHALAIDAQPLG
ncbi:MAG: BolA family transcriptional regulator [Rhodobiaceae bacterium]|nr:BolA family transcriptional regulator [Rhodobiaceae bacterium]